MSYFEVQKEKLNLCHNEKLLNGFICTHKNPILSYDKEGAPSLRAPSRNGLIYLTERNILFSPNSGGKDDIIVIPLNEITELKKQNFLFKLQKSIVIVTGKNKQEFCGFGDRNAAFQCILTLWRNVNPEGVNFTISCKCEICISAQDKTYENEGVHLKYNWGEEEEIESYRSSFDQRIEFKSYQAPNVSKKLNLEYSDKVQKSPRPSHSPTSAESPYLCRTFKGMTSFTEQSVDPSLEDARKSLRSTSASEFPEIRKDELIEVDLRSLKKLGKNITPTQNETDVLEAYFPMSLEKFWEVYFSDNAKFSFQDFYTHQKQKNFKVSKWEPVKEESKEDAFQKLKRSFNMTINISGVPFCSSSKCIRESTVTKSDEKIEYESSVSTPDVPYGNYFFLKERWVVGSTVPNGNQVYVRVFMHLDFVKSTFFKGKIESRAVKDYSDDAKLWEKLARKHIPKPKAIRKKAAPITKVEERRRRRKTAPMKKKTLVEEIVIMEEEDECET